MANDENIGGVNISITGDFSDLDAQFQAAVSKAVAEGATLAEAIQSALRPPDTGGISRAIDLVGEASIKTGIALDTLSEKVHEALESGTAKTTTEAISQAIIDLGSSAQSTGASMAPLADATSNLGASAGTANSQIKQLGDDTATAGKGAADATGNFTEAATALAAFGAAALAITAGLKAFGEAALEAFGHEQQVAIGLTAMSGSAVVAAGTISDLKEQANAFGLSQGEVLKAAQGLAATFGGGDGLTGVMKAAQESIAATGKSLSTAAMAFTQVEDAGAVTAKTLKALGLTWEDLAKAMGTSIEDAQAKLKKGGQSAAADVQALLDAIQTKFAAAAQAQGQSLLGMFNTFKNQISDLMQDIGKAIAPAFQSLMGFFSANVLPMLQEMVAGFNALPDPVKNTAVALGLAVAAIAPLAVGLAGFGLAVTSINAAIPVLSAALEGLSGSAVVLGLSLSEILIPLGLLAVGVAAIHFSGLDKEASDFAANLKGDFEGIGDLFSGVKESLASFFQGFVEGVGSSLQPFEEHIQSVWKLLSEGVGSAIEPVTSALGSLWESFKNTASEAATEAFGKIGDALDEIATKAKPATDALGHVRDVLTETTPKQEAFVAGVTAADPSLRTFAQGLAAVSNALDFLGGHYQTMTDAMTKGNPMMKENAQNMHDAAQAAMEAAGLFDKAADSTGNWTAKVKTHSDAVRVLASATRDFVDISKTYVDEENTAALAEQAHMDKIASLSQSVVHAQQLYQAMLDAYAAGKRTLEDVEKAAASLQKQIDALNKAVGDAPKVQFFNAEQKKQIEDEAAALKSVLDITTLLPAPISAANKVMIDFGITNANTGASFKQLKAGADTMIAELPQLDQMFANGQINQQKYDEGIGNLSKAMQQIAKADLPAYVSELGKIAAVQIDAHASNTVVMTDLAAYQAGINKLASVDLPAAIKEEQNYIDLLVKRGATYGQILSAEAEALQMEIKDAEQRGQDANNEVLALEGVRLKTEELKLESHGYADELVKGINELISGFDQLGSAMGTAIVEGKNLGAAMVKEFQKIGASILGDVINAALLPLKKEIMGLISDLLPNLNTGLKVSGESAAALEEGFKKEGDAINAVVDADIASTAAKQTNTGATTIDTGATTADTGATVADTGATVADAGATVVETAATIEEIAATIADTAAQIAFATTVGAVAGVVGAIAGIVGDVMLITISHDTGKIEVNTRETFAQVTNIWNDLKSDFAQTYDRMGEMLDRLNHIMDSTAQMATGGTGGGGIPAEVINKLGTDGDKTVTILGNTYSITQSILAAVQSTANDTSWIMHNSDTIAQSTADMANTLTEMYDVLLYGKSFTASSESAATSQRAAQTMSLNALVNHAATAATQRTAQGQSLNSLVAESITGNGQGREIVDNTGAAADASVSLYAPLQAQANAAAIAARQASGQLGELEQLRTELMAYEQMANIAQMQGNEALATQYTLAAQRIQAQIALVAPQVNTGLISAYEATDMSLVNAIKGVGFSANNNFDDAIGVIKDGDTIIARNIIGGAQLVSSTVAQGSMLVASSVSTAATNTAAASAQFASSLTSSLINIRGGLSSAGFTPLPLNSQGSQTPPSVAGPSNGLPPIPMSGHMGYATGGAIQTDQTAQLHAGEVVVPAVQVASQAAQMSAQATQIQDLQAQLAGLNVTLQQSLAAGDVKGSENAQGAVNDMQAKIDALTAAMQANTAATATDAAVTATTATADTSGLPAPSDAISGLNSAATAAQGTVADQLAALQSGADLSSSMPSSTFSMPDLSGSGAAPSMTMDTTGLMQAIQTGTDTLHSDLGNISAQLMSLAAHVGTSTADPGVQKWGTATPKSFDTGGYVTSDQMAMVHAGEFVVPPDVTGMLRSMASVPRAGYGTDPGNGGGSSGPGGGGVVVNAPITVTGVTDGRQLATMLEQHLKRVLSRTGKYTK